MTFIQITFLIVLSVTALAGVFLWGYLLGRSDKSRDDYIRGYLDGEASEDG